MMNVDSECKHVDYLIIYFLKVMEENIEKDFWDNGVLLMLMIVAAVPNFWYLFLAVSLFSCSDHTVSLEPNH